MPMLVEHALERLRELCAEAGLDPEHLSPAPAWQVFTAFMAEPVDVAIDGASFQCGPGEHGTNAECFAAFVRVFSDAVAEEDDEELLEAIVVELDMAPQAGDIGTIEVDSQDFPSLAAWAQHVESLPEFRAVMSARPMRSEVYAQEL